MRITALSLSLMLVCLTAFGARAAELSRETKPYELLCRWDRDGLLKGCHVGFRLIVRDGAEVLVNRAEAVMPVDVGQGKGFPLADILSQLQQDALAANATLTAERDQLAAEKAALEEELARRQPASAGAQEIER